MLALLHADLCVLVAVKPVSRQFRQLARLTISSQRWLMRRSNARELRHHCWRCGQCEARPLGAVHTGRVYALALGRRYLVSGGDDGCLHAYNTSTWAHLDSRTQGRAVKPWEIATCVSEKGQEWFAVRGRAYNPAIKNQVDFVLPPLTAMEAAHVSLVASDPLDGTLAFVSGETVHVHRGTGQLSRFDVGVQTPNALAVGGGHVAFTSGLRLRRISVCSLEGGRVETPAAFHADSVYALVASMGRIASGSDDRTVKLWLSYTEPKPRPVCTIDTGAKVWALAIAASGDLLVSAGHGNSVGNIHVWDLSGVPHNDGDPHEGLFEAVHLASLRGPPCTRSVAFDGDRVVAGGNDGVVRVWQHPCSDLLGPLMRDHAF